MPVNYRKTGCQKKMNIQVNLEEIDNNLTGFIRGEIDAHTAPVLREKLEAFQNQDGLKAVLDLSDVDYMDSTGLGVFVAFYKSVNAKGGHVKLKGLSSRLKRLFDITGLGEIMDIESAGKGGN
jgi:anti-sigma B factor antagonist